MPAKALATFAWSRDFTRGPRSTKPGHVRNRGFSLLELLLAVVLALLLVGAIVFNFSALQPGASFLEGIDRFETALRYARAYAAQTGHRVQLQFEIDPASTDVGLRPMYRILLTAESNPFDAPGVFESVPDALPDLEEANRLMGVLRSAQPGHASSTPLIPEPPDNLERQVPDFSGPPTPIIFYPDGSCDSAEILLVPRFPEETRQGVIRLAGITGTISHEILTQTSGETTEEPGSVEP